MQYIKKLNKNVKIVIGMSGGVDSSVTAALLKKAGFDVIGVFMKFWKDSDEKGNKIENSCCSLESEKRARQVAKVLDIPFYVFNFEKEFKKKIVDSFLREYKKGVTPNPCVICNKEIKFGLLMEKALKLGAEYVATGHYAINKNGRLFQGKDKNKDQSYFLWQLNQNQLKHVLFPVGNYTKDKVRKLAKKFKLPTAEAPESQEICFIPKSINEFLEKYLKIKPGNITDKNGKIIGRHKGLHFYTIGQRKGIELGGSASAKGFGETKPYYVADKDIKKNTLVVTKNEKDLLKKELIAKNVNWIYGIEPKLPLKIKAKIRYRSELVPAVIFKLQDTRYKIQFTKNQRAITPGQSVVFYLSRRSSAESGTKADKGEELIGGGIIDEN